MRYYFQCIIIWKFCPQLVSHFDFLLRCASALYEKFLFFVPCRLFLLFIYIDYLFWIFVMKSCCVWSPILPSVEWNDSSTYIMILFFVFSVWSRNYVNYFVITAITRKKNPIKPSAQQKIHSGFVPVLLTWAIPHIPHRSYNLSDKFIEDIFWKKRKKKKTTMKIKLPLLVSLFIPVCT